MQEAASPLPPSQPDHKTDIKLKLAGVEGKDRKAVWNGWTKGESQGRGGEGGEGGEGTETAVRFFEGRGLGKRGPNGNYTF